ncbi:hypothetical protein WA171_002494 [Blastocystis sp. BT1]
MPDTETARAHSTKILRPTLEINRQHMMEHNDSQFVDHFTHFLYNAENIVNRLWSAYTRQDQSRRSLKHGKRKNKVLHNHACSLCHKTPPSLILLECIQCPHFYICDHCLPLSNHPWNHPFLRVTADASCCDRGMDDSVIEKYFLSDHPSTDVNIELLPLLSRYQKDS